MWSSSIFQISLKCGFTLKKAFSCFEAPTFFRPSLDTHFCVVYCWQRPPAWQGGEGKEAEEGRPHPGTAMKWLLKCKSSNRAAVWERGFIFREVPIFDELENLCKREGKHFLVLRRAGQRKIDLCEN